MTPLSILTSYHWISPWHNLPWDQIYLVWWSPPWSSPFPLIRWGYPARGYTLLSGWREISNLFEAKLEHSMGVPGKTTCFKMEFFKWNCLGSGLRPSSHPSFYLIGPFEVLLVLEAEAFWFPEDPKLCYFASPSSHHNKYYSYTLALPIFWCKKKGKKKKAESKFINWIWNYLVILQI